MDVKENISEKEENERSRRRSSILKAPKPSRQALQEIDTNCEDDKTCDRRHSRRSSRRVSFADTCQIKEFHVDVATLTTSNNTQEEILKNGSLDENDPESNLAGNPGDSTPFVFQLPSASDVSSSNNYTSSHQKITSTVEWEKECNEREECHQELFVYQDHVKATSTNFFLHSLHCNSNISSEFNTLLNTSVNKYTSFQYDSVGNKVIGPQKSLESLEFPSEEKERNMFNGKSLLSELKGSKIEENYHTRFSCSNVIDFSSEADKGNIQKQSSQSAVIHTESSRKKTV
ncbi:uncharacterized protein LOC143222953 [Tachypleus tridentatus]|uniref:uncharacterized protein LOC143222953 n=1 Tax=Tachypleus tridentatus TaxID=6853 RepID=UPI003FCF8D78